MTSPLRYRGTRSQGGRRDPCGPFPPEPLGGLGAPRRLLGGAWLTLRYVGKTGQ